MLIHAYVFLSTVFIGLQGAAFYRHQLKKSLAVEVRELSSVGQTESLKQNSELPELWVNNENERTILAVRSPVEINSDITQALENYFVTDEENEAVQIANEKIEEESIHENNSPIVATTAPEVEENGDILVFDYAKAQTAAPKISAITTRKPKSLEIDEYLERNIQKKVDKPQTPMLYEGEYKFELADAIDSNKMELRSLINNEEVFFDDKNVGSIVKNFTSTKSTEMFQAIYPMAMPVNVKAYWQKGSKFVNYIPLLSHAFIDQLYRELNIAGEWGMVLIAINDDIDHYELENYQTIVFLDENLNEIEENLASYALYLGIPAGNQDIKMISGNTTINYPLYITENIVSFVEPQIYSEEINRNFSLYENLPLTKEYKDVYISGEQIAAVTSNAFLEKIALNSYKFDSSFAIYGNKELVLIQNEEQNYYINISEVKDKIVLPSKEYINQILDTVNDAEIQCVVEIKTNKEIDLIENKFFAQRSENIKGKVQTFTMEEVAIERHLDSDGIFYPSQSKKTKKSFFLTEDTGLLMIKIQYKDGTQETKEYFCDSKDYHLGSGEE